MKIETEQQSAPKFEGYLTEKDHRIILSRRYELSLEETESRIRKIQESFDQGLTRYLPVGQQKALMTLYPESLRLPRLAEAARSMHVSRQAVWKFDQRLMRTIDKLLGGVK